VTGDAAQAVPEKAEQSKDELGPTNSKPVERVQGNQFGQ